MNTELPPFFESLHRPFHQPLKTTRWVCEFIRNTKLKMASSSLNVEFYLHLMNKLQKIYAKSPHLEYPGLVSRHAVSSVTSRLNGLPKTKKKELIMSVMRMERYEDVDKQIYSTYKAASYYVNLSKDKLKLIDDQNCLTDFGKQLLSIKSKAHPAHLTKKESEFFFKRLLENDFLLLIALCLFKRLEFKYKFTDSDNRYFDFIKKMYRIKHFIYNNQSLANYNKVRSSWIGSMDILDARNIIRNRFMKIIQSDMRLDIWFNEITNNLKLYEAESFKSKRDYESLKERFTSSYKLCITQKKDVLGFVNLYDIKDNLKISHTNYELFLNTFYELEKAKSHIFFSNIVSSIDRRKRFRVRGVSVLKIKYKW